MIQLLTDIWEVIVALWNTGVRFARVAIRVVLGVIVVWPFVLLGVSFTGSAGFTAIVALVPLMAVLLLMLIYPLVSGVLAVLPQGRTFYLWLAVVLFGELFIGFYLAVVPVWNNPGLIPVLALLVVVLGMFLILKRQLGFQQGGWFVKGLVSAIVVVTIVFFFSGRAKEKTTEAATQAALPSVEEFTFNAGDELMTVLVGSGTFHRVRANKPWVAVSTLADGRAREYSRPAGSSSWKGGSPEGLLRVKGVENGTTLRFERINRR